MHVLHFLAVNNLFLKSRRLEVNRLDVGKTST